MRDTDNIMAGELQKSQVCVSKQFAIASQEEKKKEAHKLLDCTLPQKFAFKS